MRINKRAVFGIIMNAETLCTVWPANEDPPQGWRFTAATGTREAMQSRVDQQFVPTAPALPLELDRRYRDAEWSVAEFDDRD
jgi:uncharacterized protein YbdZ (MbtH family)